MKKISDVAELIVLMDSKLLIQWTVKNLIKLIKPIQYWLVASSYYKNISII